MIIFYICLIILGLLNFILKEWCTISRGAEPYDRKANDEKVLKKVAHTCGIFGAERSDGPEYTTSVYYFYKGGFKPNPKPFRVLD